MMSMPRGISPSLNISEFVKINLYLKSSWNIYFACTSSFPFLGIGPHSLPGRRIHQWCKNATYWYCSLVNTEVPQGYVLSPPFFPVYILDMFLCPHPSVAITAAHHRPSSLAQGSTAHHSSPAGTLTLDSSASLPVIRHQPPPSK